MRDSYARVVRTLMQIVAAGGLTWLTDQLVADLPAAYAPYVLGAYTLLVALCQNLLEDSAGHAALRRPGGRVEIGPTPSGDGAR